MKLEFLRPSGGRHANTATTSKDGRRLYLPAVLLEETLKLTKEDKVISIARDENNNLVLLNNFRTNYFTIVRMGKTKRISISISNIEGLKPEYQYDIEEGSVSLNQDKEKTKVLIIKLGEDG